MGRYFAFILLGFLIIGSGCHTATGPVESLALDTLPKPIGNHYRSFTVSFQNMLLTGNHRHWDVPSGVKTSRSDSAKLESASAWNFSTDSASTIIIGEGVIANLKGFSGWNADFGNLPFRYLTDSSIYISLKIPDAAHKGGFSQHRSQHYVSYPPASGGLFVEYWDFDDYYYDCTDQTQIEITIHYSK